MPKHSCLRTQTQTYWVVTEAHVDNMTKYQLFQFFYFILKSVKLNIIEISYFYIELSRTTIVTFIYLMKNKFFSKAMIKKHIKDLYLMVFVLAERAVTKIDVNQTMLYSMRFSLSFSNIK